MMKKLSLLFLLTSFFAHAQNPGDNLFSAPFIHTINMTFSQVSYWDSLIATHSTDLYMEGTVAIDGTVIGQCGVKTKGNSSFNNQSRKKSFKIDFNEFVSGQDIDGLKKINLNNGFKDPTMIREKLTLDFYNQHGIPAPRCTYAKVYINGIYWGLYDLVEEVDTKQFLETRFGSSAGNCFKGDPTGDLRWLGATPSLYYSKYELCTNEFQNDWSDLVRLVNMINNSGTNLQDSLETFFNTENFIHQWAMLNMFSNFDSYLGSGHNYYIYHNPLNDQFEWIAWDVNESFGTFRMNQTTTQILTMSYATIPSGPGSRPLMQNMIQNTHYQQSLAYTICDWIQSDFSNATLNPIIDSLANVIRTDLYADSLKFYSNQDFETNLSTDITGAFGLKSFITARRNSLLGQLGTTCIAGVSALENNSNLEVYPQPASDHLNIRFENANEKYIEIFNSVGAKVLSEKASGQEVSLPIALADGIYILQIDHAFTKKIIIANE